MSEPIIEIKGLTKYYGKFCALKDVNLKISRGKVYALLGRNGAGKSSLIKILTGFEDPSQGSAKIFGTDCDSLPPEFRATIAYLVEGQYLYGSMSITELKNFSRPFYKNWSDGIFDKVIKYFNLKTKSKIGTLSRGQRAQVYFAVILAYSPELLILDDPMLGLDTAARRDILEVIVSLIHNQKKTVLYSTHILNEVERVADEIGIIDNGKLIVNCDYTDLIKQYSEIRIDKNSHVDQLNKKFPFILSIKDDFDSFKIVVKNENEDFAEKFKNEDVKILSINKMPLENIFLELTAEKYSGSLYDIL